MAHYEGIVSSIKENGLAEVIIQPGSQGIPGASNEVNCRVCHVTTGGSAITVEAFNTAGSAIGDWVSVTLSSRALMRNAAFLLGIPVLGLIVGVVLAAVLTHGFSAHMETGYMSIGLSLGLGITLGVWLFRRISQTNTPIIERTVKPREEMDKLPCAPALGRNENISCQSCYFSC